MFMTNQYFFSGIQFKESGESERSMVPDGYPSIMGPVAESLFGAYRMERNPRGKLYGDKNVIKCKCQKKFWKM